MSPREHGRTARTRASATSPTEQPWGLDAVRAFAVVGSDAGGLTSDEADRRRPRKAAALGRDRALLGDLQLLGRQFLSPIMLVLLAAAAISAAVGGATDAAIIVGIVLVSGLLGFFQERGAARAVSRLLATIEVRASVLRDGVAREVPLAEVVPGDVVLLDAGSVVPADCLVIDARDLHVDEASLTGETFPAEKCPGVLALDTPLAARTNTVFCGTHVVSGTGRALALRTGCDTLFGDIAERLRRRDRETEFERGVRRFGVLLVEITLLLVLGIFAVNVYLARPVLESLLFAVALAVGLTPQLLPAIVSVNLAHGARRMAARQVIVRRLASIEDFGSMSVLCTDKTGTLTEAAAQLSAALDPSGAPCDEALVLARLNARLHEGFANPLDDALKALPGALPEARKLDDVPYDFNRRRLSVLVERDGESLLITKGAVNAVLAVCTRAASAGGEVPLDAVRARIEEQRETLSAAGHRTLAVARRRLSGRSHVTVADEAELTFVGLLVFAAPLKEGAADAVARLEKLGVRLKMLTGDNRYVAAHVATALGLGSARVLTGGELRAIDERALVEQARQVDVFAELEPHQKLAVVRALRAGDEVVGFLGDGINDAAALHAADVGISVDNAADVAKEAADIVLLRKDLDVLAEGVENGRSTFANTLKYVFMATSANFGNMFSMAGASLFLPFLPLLPKQVLLTNLLTDLPEMTIAGDRVDPELVERARRWDVAFIRRFMIVFGLLSSIFDYCTFAVLRVGLHAGMIEFRTGWFVESVASASLIVLAIRTRRPLWRSRPGRWLAITTAVVVIATAIMPMTPLAPLFGFGRLPPSFWPALGGILVLYVGSAELTKRLFYRRKAT
jgi:Mg2+-importing ATPase